MFDQKIRSQVDPWLEKIAVKLHEKEISPNTVTFIGGMIAVYCFVALALGAYALALIFLIANRIADGLDGVLAHYIDRQSMQKKTKKKGATELGSFLDIVFDMVFYGGFVFFFALGRPDIGDAATFLLFGFLATSASFLAYALIIEKCGNAQKPRSKNKGFYYATNMMEGAETIGFFILMCLFPGYFNIIAVIFGVFCLASAGLRIKLTYNEYKT